MLWAAVGVGLDRDLGVVVIQAGVQCGGCEYAQLPVAMLATQLSWIPAGSRCRLE